MRPRPLRLFLAALALVTASAGAEAVRDGGAEARFREATEAVRGGDSLRAIAIYAELAGGRESASLYWNWAQAAGARGAHGEALWALLRGREVDPGDRGLDREIDRVREAAGLDPAETSPEPLAAAARFGRFLHLDLAAIALLALSVVVGLAARHSPRGALTAAALLGLGVLAASLPLLGALARPTAVVVRAQAPLLESASSTAATLGSLREGEVVPVLAETSGYRRVEDSSGARGWAALEDVRRLDRPPAGPQ